MQIDANILAKSNEYIDEIHFYHTFIQNSFVK